MKIGILTFHSAHNYGAVLQVYALQSTLMKYFDDVEVIDYRPEFIKKSYENKLRLPKNSTLKFRIRAILSYLYKYNSRKKKGEIFNKFINKHLKLSKQKYYKYTELKNLDYDIYILGSDQIWNPNITKGFDPVFFGVFPEINKKSIIVSYAASIGLSYLDEETKNKLRTLIEKIDYISVREEQAKKIINDISEQKVEVVLDPTLLLSAREWNEIIIPPNIKGNYLLVYTLENNEIMLRSAEKLAKQLGLKVIEIRTMKKFGIFGHKSISDAGPRELLGLIKNARIVITNSFHGTTFSIIFRKNFYTYAHSKVPSRMIDLLTSLDLEDRLLNFDQSISTFSEIDYKNIEHKIDKYKKKSLAFIENALKS